MQDDMSKQELLGKMIENKMKPQISPQNAVQAMEKSKLKDVFGSARKSAASVSPMSVRSIVQNFGTNNTVMEVTDEDEETRRTKKKQANDEQSELSKILNSSMLFQYAYLEKLLLACKEEGIPPSDWSAYFNTHAIGAKHNYELKQARAAVQELLIFAEEQINKAG